MTDLSKLRVLAEKATPGPWEHDGVSHYVEQPNNNRAARFTVCGTEDAAFIAAASPDVVIALLDDNAQLREACATWQNHFTDTPGLAAANAEIVSLRMQLAAMTAACDEACEIGYDALHAAHDSATEGHGKWRSKLQRLAELRKAGAK